MWQHFSHWPINYFSFVLVSHYIFLLFFLFYFIFTINTEIIKNIFLISECLKLIDSITLIKNNNSITCIKSSTVLIKLWFENTKLIVYVDYIISNFWLRKKFKDLFGSSEKKKEKRKKNFRNFFLWKTFFLLSFADHLILRKVSFL